MSGQGVPIPPLIPANFDAQSGFVDLLKVDTIFATTLDTTDIVATGAVTVGTAPNLINIGDVTSGVGNLKVSGTVTGATVTATGLLLCGVGQAGTATLVAGTVTVTLPVAIGLSSSDVVVVTRNTPGGTVGDLSVPVGSYNTGARTFVINSASGTDTSTVNWYLVRQY